MTNSSPWKNPPFLIGKPSISSWPSIPWRTVSHNQMVLQICRSFPPRIPLAFSHLSIANKNNASLVGHILILRIYVSYVIRIATAFLHSSTYVHHGELSLQISKHRHV